MACSFYENTAFRDAVFFLQHRLPHLPRPALRQRLHRIHRCRWANSRRPTAARLADAVQPTLSTNRLCVLGRKPAISSTGLKLKTMRCTWLRKHANNDPEKRAYFRHAPASEWFLELNCAAVPGELIESEPFG